MSRCAISTIATWTRNKQLKRLGKVNDSVKLFNDYREMIDQMGDKIDAVTVSIPDHSHASASVLAMKKGKHCFTQKPLTWSVYEARRMREVANEMKVATQMGNQGTADHGFRTAVEIIRSGAIGPVKEVHVWTNRPIWPQGEGRPNRTDPIPKFVHWDLFLGPAPERPYVNDVYHPFKWRGWLDFGTGALGDMACHTANMAVMSLELFDPVAVEVKNTSGIVAGESYPKFSVIEYEFPERTTILFKQGVKLPPCKLIWYDGQQYPPNALLQGEKRADSGMVLVGDQGSLYTPDDYGAEHVLLPRNKFDHYAPPAKFIAANVQPLQGVGDGLPRRSPGHVELQLRLTAHRNDDPGQPGAAGRLAHRMGRQEPGRDQQSCRQQIRPPRVSFRLYRLNDGIDSQARGLLSAGFFLAD